MIIIYVYVNFADLCLHITKANAMTVKLILHFQHCYLYFLAKVSKVTGSLKLRQLYKHVISNESCIETGEPGFYEDFSDSLVCFRSLLSFKCVKASKMKV